MVQLFLDGGGFMWPILVALIIGLIFVVERLVHLLSGLGTGEKFTLQVAESIKSQGFDSAKALCNKKRGPISNLNFNALDRAHLGAEEAEATLDHTGAIEMAALEKNMTWISLMIGIAPMLGFLGTVWGMITAFNDIKAANDMTPQVVAGGISQALLTTAFGLIAAIILQFLQNVCLYIIDNQIVNMQKSTTILLEAIKDTEQK